MSNQETLVISHKALVSLVSELISGTPNPEEEDSPGPWDPVLRRSWERVLWALGPRPEPWARVALNPQPLPPRIAFAVALAREVVDRVDSLHELAETLGDSGGERPREVAGALLERFVDDCGNGRFPRPPFPKWPFPWPPPWPGLTERLESVDIIVIGAELARASARATHEELRRNLEEAGRKLVEAGVSHG